MKRFFFLLFILVFQVVNFSQSRPFYLMVSSPEYIPVDHPFEISIFARISEANTRVVNFYLLVDEKIKIQDAMLCSETDSFKLKFRQTEFRGYLGKAYKIDLGLDSASALFDSFFEVCVGFNARGLSETEIALGLEVEFKDGTKEYFSSYDQYNDFYPLPLISIDFYEPQSLAGNSLQLIGPSKITLQLKDQSVPGNLMIEFWAKLDALKNDFFGVIDETSLDTIVSLSSNKYKVVAPAYSKDLEVFDRVFLGKNSWNHYVIYLNKAGNLAEVYLNAKMIFRIPFERHVNFADLKFNFQNSDSGKDYQIDLLKVWEFNNSIERSLLNRHYINYEADSSRLLLNLTFDDTRGVEQFNEISNTNIEFRNVEFAISDAPIFSQAPEMNVYVYGSFYSIEWSNKESKYAEEFVLEKSLSGWDFVEIHREMSSDDPDKIYYYSDLKNINDEIVVYRLKQINEDGTVIYSPQVKIGQGEKESFSVGQNFPNPFNPTTNISVEITEQTEVEIYVFNVVGKKIAKLHEGVLSQGVHSFTFDGSNLPSGIYFFEVKSPTNAVVRKMILAK